MGSRLPLKKITLTIVFCFVLLFYFVPRAGHSEVVIEEEAEALHTIEYMEHPAAGAALIGDDQPISRGMAAKMLALIFKNTTEIQALPNNHPFEDVSSHHWHYPYINAVYSLEIMRGDGRRFLPDSPLTVGQAQSLLILLDQNNAPTFANIQDPNLPITYALWVDLYKSLLESLSGDQTIYEAFGIISIDIIILATASNSSLPEGHLISDQGPFRHGGLALDSYIDRQIRVLAKDGEIIALDALVSEQPTIRNVYIAGVTSEVITVFAGGAERNFYRSGERTSDIDLIQVGAIADIVIHNGHALFISPLTESVAGTLLRISNNSIEIRGQGIFPLDADFRVYDITDGPARFRNKHHLIVGTSAARFYLRDGKIGAGVITHDEFPENIRVVIGNSNFGGLIHRSLTITSTGEFWITAGTDERIMELAPGQRFTISDIENTDLLGHFRLFFHTVPGETLQLIGLSRNWPQNASPRYRGVIEIAREPNGYSVVNELCLEEYLFAVVPSEMPTVFGLEAAKVQAVTARSFAVQQIMANRFYAFGGNVDDSVMSQVYNNIPENDISIEAVNATRGMILWYGDTIVQANFFSTSAGMTANSGEVWPAGGIFPGNTPSFLRARPQFPANQLDLSDEERARAFFRSLEIDAYDRNSPWFRWQLEMTKEELAASINTRYEIGNLIDMQVVSRGEGGNVMELRLIGDNMEATVMTELNIRNLLRPARAAGGDRDIVIRRHDGSSLLNQNMLPSAFFTFEFDGDTVIFHGGGHGHGVGMSQNGVRGMVELGYTFEEILEHFYPGTFIGAVS